MWPLVLAFLLTWQCCCVCTCSVSATIEASTCASAGANAVHEASRNLTQDAVDHACQVLDNSLDCVLRTLQVGQCSSSLYGLHRSLANLQSTFCSESIRCLATYKTCRLNYPSVNLTTTSSHLSAEYCQSVLPLIQCVQTNMEPGCAVIPSISQYVDAWSNLEFNCQETTCGGVQQCQTTMKVATQTSEQIDNSACLAYRDYAKCLHDVLPSCENFQRRTDQPEPGTIATYITEGCTLLSETNKMYSCGDFQTCFHNFMERVYEFSPHKLCNVVQGTMGCAVSTAQKCRVADAEQFITRSNNFMLHIANTGCGIPKLELGNCAGFNTCITALKADVTTPQPLFFDLCSTIATFQQCASDIMPSCSLEETVRPSLHQLSRLSSRFCTAVKNRRLENCTEFMQCLKTTKLPPLNAATLSSFQWCNLTLSTLQCAKTYSSECKFPSAVRVTLLDIYTDAISQGCTNVYKVHLATTENGADHKTYSRILILHLTVAMLLLFLQTELSARFGDLL